MPRLLLYISADSHSLYRWERSGLQLLQRFKPEDIARARLKARAGTLQVVADLEREDFHEDHIPFLRGAERRAVIERRLAQRYPDTRLAAALSLGHATDERRNERLLLTSLSDAQPVVSWLADQDKAKVRVAGVHSTAHVAAALAARLGARDERFFLMTANEAGLRQTFVEKGRLRFSRLARTQDNGSLTSALVRTETERMLKYLATQRALPDATRPTRILLVVPDGERTHFTRTLGSAAGLAFTTIGLSQASRRIGLRRLPAGAGCEVLYLHLAARRPPKEQFLRSESRRNFVAWQVQRSLVGAGVAGFVSCGAYAASLWIEQWMVRQRIDGVQRETVVARSQLADASTRLPSTPAPIEMLKASALEFRRIAARTPAPEAAFLHVSQALDQSPRIELDALAWSADPEQVLEITGRVSGAAHADHRAIANEVQRFGALLESDARWRIVATRLPLDLSSEGVLAATAAVEGTEAPRFSLRVARNPG